MGFRFAFYASSQDSRSLAPVDLPPPLGRIPGSASDSARRIQRCASGRVASLLLTCFPFTYTCGGNFTSPFLSARSIIVPSPSPR